MAKRTAYLCTACGKAFSTRPLAGEPVWCPSCDRYEAIVQAAARAKGDDDGVEYGDPRDGR
jgi:predicted ATP-dependent serine protease